MKNLMLFLIITLFNVVISKSDVSSLTESLGHEVIEIGPTIKELPPGLEEEPSGENNEDDLQSTTTTSQPATKQETEKTTTTASTSTSKAISKDGVVQEEDEAKIEKELADMYKDNSDYKSDSNEITIDTSTAEGEESKPIVRQRTGFKFQPDIHNRAEVERFRTSVDDISCEKRSTEKLSAESPLSQSASKCYFDIIYGLLAAFILL